MKLGEFLNSSAAVPVNNRPVRWRVVGRAKGDAARVVRTPVTQSRKKRMQQARKRSMTALAMLATATCAVAQVERVDDPEGADMVRARAAESRVG